METNTHGKKDYLPKHEGGALGKAATGKAVILHAATLVRKVLFIARL